MKLKVNIKLIIKIILNNKKLSKTAFKYKTGTFDKRDNSIDNKDENDELVSINTFSSNNAEVKSSTKESRPQYSSSYSNLDATDYSPLYARFNSPYTSFDSSIGCLLTSPKDHDEASPEVLNDPDYVEICNKVL